MIEKLINSLTTSNAQPESKPCDFTEKIENLRNKAVEYYPEIRRTKDGSVAGNINSEDAHILFQLVSYTKPETIFEIGTWIGTSSMIMADALASTQNNSGTIYTCDGNKYYSLQNDYSQYIKYINLYSDKAIEEIPPERNIDFVFSDGELTFKTLEKLLKKISSDAIIVTHDYKRPAEKGVRNVLRVQLMTGAKYVLILPAQSKSSIAVLVPTVIAKKLNLEYSNRLLRQIQTIYIFFSVHSVLVARAVKRKLTN